MDNTDRNRTSPFAFTGNKFEFRAVGSKANCAVPMAALNTMVADQLNKFADAIDKETANGTKRDEAILRQLQKLIKSSKKIRFEGNGYGDEWIAEANKRGLSNVSDTPRALQFLLDKKVKDLYSRNNVFTHRELEARVEIELEKYQMQIQIESRMCGNLAVNHIIPTAIGYQNVLIENITGIKAVMLQKSAKKASETQMAMVTEISERVERIKTLVDKMINERKKANKIEDAFKQAVAYCDKIKPLMDQIRYDVDKLEMLVDDRLWPMPKLRELLFTR
jgi:glutamine synthetase